MPEILDILDASSNVVPIPEPTSNNISSFSKFKSSKDRSIIDFTVVFSPTPLLPAYSERPPMISIISSTSKSLRLLNCSI